MCSSQSRVIYRQGNVQTSFLDGRSGHAGPLSPAVCTPRVCPVFQLFPRDSIARWLSFSRFAPLASGGGGFPLPWFGCDCYFQGVYLFSVFRFFSFGQSELFSICHRDIIIYYLRGSDALLLHDHEVCVIHEASTRLDSYPMIYFGRFSFERRK